MKDKKMGTREVRLQWRIMRPILCIAAVKSAGSFTKKGRGKSGAV
jgi:hypothetical protein